MQAITLRKTQLLFEVRLKLYYIFFSCFKSIIGNGFSSISVAGSYPLAHIPRLHSIRLKITSALYPYYFITRLFMHIPCWQTSLDALPPVCAWTPEWFSRMENMDLASFFNYMNSYVLSVCNLLGHDPEEMSGELFGPYGGIAYSRVLGKEFQEVFRGLIFHI